MAASCFAIGALTLLGGCSTLRLVYGQAATLAYWWLDGYIDFNDKQSPRVNAALNEGLRWHRETQLPDAVALLARARTEVLEPATPAQVCRWFDDGVQRADLAFEHMLPAIAELVPTLTAKQLATLQRKYEKNDEKFTDDYLQRDPVDRFKAAVTRTVDRAETLYGSLDRAQRERITAGVAQSPYDPQAALEERKRFQRDVLDNLRRLQAESANATQIQAALRAVVQRVKVSPNEVHRSYQQRLLQYNCNFIAQIHNATHPEQRQRAAKTLKGWDDDFRSLLAPAA